MFTLYVLLIAAHRVYRPGKLLFCRLHREVTNHKYIYIFHETAIVFSNAQYIYIYFKLLVKKYIFGDSVLLYNRD